VERVGREEVTMSWTERFDPAHSGTRVEVRSRFDRQWVSGFEVAEPVEEPDPGYRIRRRSDRFVLPIVFSPEDVRVDRGRGPS
jgi:hypothetical protein